jgi:hypothetical protein
MRCKVGGYLPLGLEIQTRGRFFLTTSFEGLVPLGPVEACLRLPRMIAVPEGGVLVRGDHRIDFEGGAAHVALGLGASIPMGFVKGEARVRIGAARGQNEFQSALLPSIAAGLVAAFFEDHVIVAFDRRWFHIPHWTMRFATEQEWIDRQDHSRPSGAGIERDWQRWTSLTFGFRF